ncbi:MAG: molybdate ABC transporter substrate-binding protein [Acidobacteriota bacterium]|nr:molybdate ABC transporter substrate-binding protein [Acidobacteriota bacterium]
MMRGYALLAVAALFCGAAERPEVNIAAAANLGDVFRAAGPRFEAATGIHPVFSFGSTAQLTQQIEHSAPFDVFAAADASHVDQLQREGKLVAGTKAVYATGVLALWIPPASHAKIARIEDLASPEVRVIAVARPELAPYGAATIETLRKLGIWGKVRPKIVYGDSISMAKQYGTSGNADAVFTAYSLVLKEGGKAMPVDESLHQPIAQSLGVIAGAAHEKAAILFAEFLLRGKGREILSQYGYRVAEARR